MDSKSKQNSNQIPKLSLWKKALILGGLMILGSVIFLYFFLFRIPKDFPQGKIVTFEQNSGLRSFSKVLYDEHVISSRVAFEFFVIMKGGEKHLIPGDYFFPDQIPVFEVAQRVISGDKGLAPIRLTIPEGFTNLEIANLAESKFKDFDKSSFLENARQGYLFPETYFFITTDTDQDILEKINDTFDFKISSIKGDIKKSGKSLDEVIIMASIIEREAKGDADRDAISSILWKRISLDMPLQADAAPETYKTKGLPKEPIANPGIASIKAAIFPKPTDFLYYIHDKEGQIHFAKNYSEHRQNIKKYLR